MFVHHVFFWLKEDLEIIDIHKFETGVETLTIIDLVKTGDVGKPAKTDRPVIEKSYSYSLLLIFENQEDHDKYQVHPTHLEFVSNCSSLWQKVLIYDTESL